MKTLAIITARGGSKRIPRKNIKEFLGKPILAYSIEAALNSGIFDEVMVSTDDEEIKQVAEKYGAKVPFLRSEKTANDFATTNDVLFEVLDEYKKRGEEYDIAACIYPTAPFISAKRLSEAFGKFENSGADSLVPVVSFSYPLQRALVIRDDKLIFEHPEYMKSRSQDLEPHYHDAGQFYFFVPDRLRVTGSLLSGNVLPFPLSEMEVQDIDNETDWQLAELKYKLING